MIIIMIARRGRAVLSVQGVAQGGSMDQWNQRAPQTKRRGASNSYLYIYTYIYVYIHILMYNVYLYVCIICS